MLMQHKMPVGSNTPGAASSAADFGGVSEGFGEARMFQKLIFGFFLKYVFRDHVFGRLLLDF